MAYEAHPQSKHGRQIQTVFLIFILQRNMSTAKTFFVLVQRAHKSHTINPDLGVIIDFFYILMTFPQD